MKSRGLAAFAAALVMLSLNPAAGFAADATPTLSEVQATYADIRATLGSVPTFFQQFPPDAIPGAWQVFKALSGPTDVPNKYKELIGLAVAGQIPCQYCIYAHKAGAKANGASEQEVHEAVAEASLTRFWSTILNGLDQDEKEYQLEIQRAVEHMSAAKTAPALPPARNAESAYRQMTEVFGFVPTFMKGVPEEIITGAWNEFVGLELNPSAAIPNKYKSLMSLAIAAQIPCHYCIFADKEFAKLDGATDAEIGEAIAMAALTRHWSTYLNGIAMDEKTFRQEMDAVMAAMKMNMAKN